MIDFFQKIIEVLNKLGIKYMLSGSVAMSIYIVPRATRDFDFIINLHANDVEDFVENFKEGYYCEKEAIFEAINHLSMFNIIDHKSGFKADFVILKNSTFRQEEFARRVEIDFFGQKIYVVSEEDLIISKLIWIQDLHSGIQMEDLKNLLILKDLDFSYIHKWIKKLKLQTFNLII